MDVKIGSAPDSWGVWFPSDPQQPPWRQFLDEVAEAGYDWIELGPYGYLPTELATLRAELQSRRLSLAAGFVFGCLDDPARWPEVERQLLGAGELLAPLGAKFLVLIQAMYSDLHTGEPLAPPRLGEDAWKHLIETTHRVAEIAKDRFGLECVFHPHAETPVEYDDQIESFLHQTDPDLVKICLDTGHHAYRGGDVIGFMRRHHARIPYLHVKNVDPAVRARVEAERIPFADAVALDMFCEPARGAVDFHALRDLLVDIDFRGWMIVEHDMYPAPPAKPLPIARRTRAFLREIGIG